MHLILPLLLALPACRHAPPTAAPEAAPPSWEAPLGHDHPWLGRIWSEAEGRWIDRETLLSALDGAEVVLLGEVHDHPDHHRLRAEVIRALGTPEHAVVFEQLDTAQEVEAADPAELAAVSGWAETGWPDFALYAPLFEAVYEVGAQVVAGHPTRAQVRQVATEGLDALPPEVTADLPLRPLPDPLREDLVAEIVAGHCHMFGPERADPLVAAQTFKDAHMARAIAEAGPPAVLIAGNGHLRPDRGVPFYLDPASTTVAFLEVRDETPEGPPEVGGAADYVWFTARRHDEDPCERYREQLEGMAP